MTYIYVCANFFKIGIVGLRVPQTLERFELWGACGDLNLPSLPTRGPHSLARRARREKETQQFILVWATLWCNTLLQHFGGLPRGAEDELVQWMNRPQEVRCS